MDVDFVRKKLIDAVINQRIEGIPETFQAIMSHDSKFCLEPEYQLKLAQLFIKNHLYELAVNAYQILISSYPDTPISQHALFEAGKIFFNHSGMEKESVWFLKNFLKTNPSGEKFHEAIEMFRKLQKKMEFQDEHKIKESLSKDSEKKIIADKFKQKKKMPNQSLEKEEKKQQLVDLDVFMYGVSPEKNIKKPVSDTSSIPLVSENKFGKILKSDTEDLSLNLQFFDDDNPKTRKPQKKTEGIPEVKIDKQKESAQMKPESYKIQQTPKSLFKEFISPQIEKSIPMEIPELPVFPELKDEELKEPVQDKAITKKTKYESATYSVIFEPGQTIEPDIFVNIISEIINVEPKITRKRLMHGKGIILRNIECSNALVILKRFYENKQKVLAIREDDILLYKESKEVLHCNFFDSGFNCVTAHDTYKILSKEIFLISFGGIKISSESNSNRNVLDIFVQSPHIRLRFWETTFNFKQSGINYEPTHVNNIYNLIKKLSAVAPHAILCPNIKTILKHPERQPRHFHSILEFENYGDWLLFSYFGKDLGKKMYLFE